MDILRLALLCLHFLAWPLVALGFPLIASIRAVETGSIHHMRKLLTYWTLFALISLFEFTFSIVVQRIPFWSSIRLAAVFWLVLPQFDGACNAYQRLVCLLSSVSRRAVTDRLKEGRGISMEENIQENESEALGDLIATKQECSDSQREIQERNASCGSILLKEPNAAQQDDGKLQIRPPVKKGEQQEWKCDLCKVKTSSENNLKDHLKGGIHKANCRSFKAVMLNAHPEHQLKAKEGRIFQGHCKVCDVKILSEDGFVAHFNGKRHLFNIQKMGWKCDLCKVKTSSENNLKDHLKGGIHKANCRSFMLNAQPEHQLKAKEGRIFQGHCNVCDVKIFTEDGFFAHFNGKRHLSNIQNIATPDAALSSSSS